MWRGDRPYDRAVASRAVRAAGTRFITGGKDDSTCTPFAYAGVNVWDLMDTGRYPTIRWRVDNKLDGRSLHPSTSQLNLNRFSR